MKSINTYINESISIDSEKEYIVFIWENYDKSVNHKLLDLGFGKYDNINPDDINIDNPITCIFEGDIMIESSDSINLFKEGRFGDYKIFSKNEKNKFISELKKYYKL